jgi:hypothetical protein
MLDKQLRIKAIHAIDQELRVKKPQSLLKDRKAH